MRFLNIMSLTIAAAVSMAAHIQRSMLECTRPEGQYYSCFGKSYLAKCLGHKMTGYLSCVRDEADIDFGCTIANGKDGGCYAVVREGANSPGTAREHDKLCMRPEGSYDVCDGQNGFVSCQGTNATRYVSCPAHEGTVSGCAIATTNLVQDTGSCFTYVVA